MYDLLSSVDLSLWWRDKLISTACCLNGCLELGTQRFGCHAVRINPPATWTQCWVLVSLSLGRHPFLAGCWAVLRNVLLDLVRSLSMHENLGSHVQSWIVLRAHGLLNVIFQPTPFREFLLAAWTV